MPNIPNVPGVPALSSFSPNNIVLLASDVVGAIADFLLPQWGIFQDGFSVIDADNIVSVDLKQDLPVSDYPIEEGGFQSYNKVQLPTDIRVRLSSGGSVLNRAAFLSSVQAVMNTLDLYDVVMPETAFVGYNFSHWDFSRTAAKGSGLLEIDLWLTQIRESATATFQNTKQPGNAGAVNTGNQQGQTPSADATSAVAAGVQ